MSDGPGEPGWFEVDSYAERAAIVVVASGEVDSQSIPALRASVADAISRPGTGCVVLDLNEVVFFGSTGIAYLTQTDAEARAKGVELRVVVDPTTRVHRVLDVMGMTRLLTLYSTRTEALADQ